MAYRRTIERILRDDDDLTGQTVRGWMLVEEDGDITISRDEHAAGFRIPAGDVEAFIADIRSLTGFEAPVDHLARYNKLCRP